MADRSVTLGDLDTLAEKLLKRAFSSIDIFSIIIIFENKNGLTVLPNYLCLHSYAEGGLHKLLQQGL